MIKEKTSKKLINKKLVFFLLILIIIILFLPGCKNQDKYLQFITKEEPEMIRNPAVAGAFYPADKTNLINQINSFFKKTKNIKREKPLRILIVPHAGYDYSGQTAAWGFKQLEGMNYSRIIILGSSHRAHFSEAAVYNKGAWQTPLGKVEIDEDLADSLIIGSDLIKSDLNAHQEEHSLEVEVPFLQQILSDFKIVPILLGHSDDQVLQSLAEAIVNNLDQETLLVISSDLSHYPDYPTANKVDQETIDSILTGEVDQFNQKINQNLSQPGVDTCACGAEAIKVAMIMAQKAGLKTIKLINYSNSGDTGADKSRVVGYASIGFYGEVPEEKDLLNKKEQEELLQLARQTLESYLKDKKIPSVKLESEILNQKLGAFVTLRKNGQLRGCIGEFEPKKPLYKVVQDKAIDAALHDPRFSPVKYQELKDLEIEISVLSPRRKINDWQKIKLGKHGVVIKKGIRGGTYLPQVATETGWDLKTFLANLCSSKAGLASDCYKDPKTEIFVFTAQVFSELAH